MSKITEFFVFIASVVLIGTVGVLVYLAIPVQLKNITLIPVANTNIRIEVAKADYSRLFNTLTYTSEGNKVTLDVRQFRMLVKDADS